MKYSIRINKLLKTKIVFPHISIFIKHTATHMINCYENQRHHIHGLEENGWLSSKSVPVRLCRMVISSCCLRTDQMWSSHSFTGHHYSHKKNNLPWLNVTWQIEWNKSNNLWASHKYFEKVLQFIKCFWFRTLNSTNLCMVPNIIYHSVPTVDGTGSTYTCQNTLW